MWTRLDPSHLLSLLQTRQHLWCLNFPSAGVELQVSMSWSFNMQL
jgi:hypothetical protein